MKPGTVWDGSFKKAPAAFRRLCVETDVCGQSDVGTVPAAFRRLCVETLLTGFLVQYQSTQPPSGGCVLKPEACGQGRVWQAPAAFRRLCVETTAADTPSSRVCQPPSGGCVLKLQRVKEKDKSGASRLQAAVC